MRAFYLGCIAALALCGCVSGTLSVRRLPPETPAANNAAAIKHAIQRAAAAKEVAERAAGQDASQTLTPLTSADAPSMYSYDPWERMNRFFYRFNARLDTAIFLPVVNVYLRAPLPLRSGVRNFFLNLSEPKSVVNYLLQLRPVPGLRSLGRF